jgi:predicted transcriptional regulator YdeE
MNIKNSLQKLTQNYVWLPRLLLSKGNNAEYIILTKRTYTMAVDSGVYANVSFEMKGKNEGFENVTVPAGTYNAYKVKATISIEVSAYGQKLDSFEMIQYIWVSDDLDWWIKQYQPTTKSNLFGVIELGKEIELTSVQ